MWNIRRGFFLDHFSERAMEQWPKPLKVFWATSVCVGLPVIVAKPPEDLFTRFVLILGLMYGAVVMDRWWGRA